MDEYKLYRNKISSLIRLSKKKYFHYFEVNICNIKKIWDGINNIINRKQKKAKIIPALKRIGDRGEIVDNPKELPDILN